DEDERNLSPFHYRNWLFAQQGNLNREELFRLLDPPHAESLDGESGGEAFFHWIVQNIKKTRDLVPSLLDSLRQVGSDGVAFLLSNGRWLFAYQSGHHLYYLERRFSTSEHIFHYHVTELEANITSSTLATESAILISSKKLSDESWCEVPENHLLAVTPRLDIILVDLAERAAETA
ncbi:class II glutamine amidotransferase, partial [Thermogutta sp.]|uniref:class II glutamine amidotransferase n=1 Tax=Thermogutta sp. TaxID=1962930 RepID=UPI003C7AA92A